MVIIRLWENAWTALSTQYQPKIIVGVFLHINMCMFLLIVGQVSRPTRSFVGQWLFTKSYRRLRCGTSRSKVCRLTYTVVPVKTDNINLSASPSRTPDIHPKLMYVGPAPQTMDQNYNKITSTSRVEMVATHNTRCFKTILFNVGQTSVAQH